MTCAHRPSVCNRRDAPALVTCLLPSGKTAWPSLYAADARKNRAPEKEARSIRRAGSRPRCAGSDPRTS